jgi:hypothetical protein
MSSAPFTARALPRPRHPEAVPRVEGVLQSRMMLKIRREFPDSGVSRSDRLERTTKEERSVKVGEAELQAGTRIRATRRAHERRRGGGGYKERGRLRRGTHARERGLAKRENELATIGSNLLTRMRVPQLPAQIPNENTLSDSSAPSSRTDFVALRRSRLLFASRCEDGTRTPFSHARDCKNSYLRP